MLCQLVKLNIFFSLLDDEEDVHYCGRCKLSFTDLSEYIKHKANKVCRDANKSTLTEVVNKLPISPSPSPEKSKQKSSTNATGSPTANAGEKSQEEEEKSDSSSEKRVEVQFLEPLVAGGSDSGRSAGDEDDSKPSKCYFTKQCVHVTPKYYCNTLFPQNKCLVAYFK